MDQSAPAAGDTALRTALAQADLVLGGTGPVLSHLLAAPNGTMISEAIVARVRGMLTSLALQIFGNPDKLSNINEIERLSDELARNEGVLRFCHALAFEAELTESLERGRGIDQILSPLMQELIASPTSEIAELAMQAMTAQSRFVQSQRRMEASVHELPAELFSTVLKMWKAIGQDDQAEAVKKVRSKAKKDYDEGAGRAGLLNRLVSSLGEGRLAALDISHAGVAVFATALSAKTSQPRDLAVLSCHKDQRIRLAIGLRAAGLDEAAIRSQFQTLHKDVELACDLAAMLPDQAQSILNDSDLDRKSVV